MEVYVDDEAKLTLHGLQQYYVRLKENEKNRKLLDLLDALEFNQVFNIIWFLWIDKIYLLFSEHHSSLLCNYVVKTLIIHRIKSTTIHFSQPLFLFNQKYLKGCHFRAFRQSLPCAESAAYRAKLPINCHSSANASGRAFGTLPAVQRLSETNSRRNQFVWSWNGHWACEYCVQLWHARGYGHLPSQSKNLNIYSLRLGFDFWQNIGGQSRTIRDQRIGNHFCVRWNRRSNSEQRARPFRCDHLWAAGPNRCWDLQ